MKSEVGEESLRMVDEYRQKGLMKESDGCVGMDLEAYGLGFCMFLKSVESTLIPCLYSPPSFAYLDEF